MHRRLAYTMVLLITACGDPACKQATPTAPSMNVSDQYTSVDLFCRAALKDDLPKMNQLLSNGLSPNIRDGHGVPLLSTVSVLGKPLAVNILLSHGAEVNALDSFGTSALTGAVIAHHADIVKLLLDRGADTNLGRSDSIPLYEVTDPDICRLLITHHAKVNGPEHAKKTPLHDAAAMGSLEVVKILMQEGADVRALNSSGHTPMLRAAQLGQWDCVAYMANNGGNVTEFDDTDDNKTILHYAALAHNVGAIKALVAHGALLDAKDKRGRTPLDYAHLGGWSGPNASDIYRLLSGH